MGERIIVVSVIIPVYNGEQHINNIIECFKRQICTDFELIFVDDGSHDNTFITIEKYKSIVDFKIVAYKQDNGGVSSARNKGIELSIGEYLCFVDVDDDITETYILDMSNILQSGDCDMVICKSVNVPYGEEYYNYISTIKGNFTVVQRDKCLSDYLYGKIVSGVCFIMVNKSVITENNIRFAEGYKYSEDLHMIWRLIANSNNIAYLNKELYVYRMQPGSATSKFNEERFHGFELMKNLETFFDERGIPFAEEYKKYGAAKIMWSIMWQAAIYYEKKDFLTFTKIHDAKTYMKRLATFKNIKVSLSSIIFLFSNTLFFQLSRLFGKHKNRRLMNKINTY